MGKLKKKKKKKIDSEEYIRINKSISRLEELERNGWRWIAKDRPHKNKKKYNRKRDRKIDFLSLNYFNYEIQIIN